MKIKELIKTKTFWGGLSLVAYGIVQIKEDPQTGIQNILTGVSIIFLRDAIGKQEQR